MLDRAGVTGDDGASHNGMWDMSILSVVPGLRLAAPRDEATLREALRESVAIADGPSVVRFPKGALPPDIPALERRGPVDVLRRGERARTCCWSPSARWCRCASPSPSGPPTTASR